MSHQTSHLGVLVIRPEVEMQSALGLLALTKPDELQPRHAIRLRADLELLIGGVDHNPTKSRSPPLPQGHRIFRVNNYLFPFQGHLPRLDVPGLGTTGTQATLIGLNPSVLPLAEPPPPAGSAHTDVQVPQTRWFRATTPAAPSAGPSSVPRCAVLDDYQLDDYQGVALSLAAWSPPAGAVDVRVPREPFRSEDEAVAAIEAIEAIDDRETRDLESAPHRRTHGEDRCACHRHQGRAPGDQRLRLLTPRPE